MTGYYLVQSQEGATIKQTSSLSLIAVGEKRRKLTTLSRLIIQKFLFSNFHIILLNTTKYTNKFDKKISQGGIGILKTKYRSARMEADCNSSKLIFGQNVQKSKPCNLNLLIVILIFLCFQHFFGILLLPLQDHKAQLQQATGHT